ncbi:(S)-benzoin forming benzil reductase [Sporosalibacterium faouarense]|uniref:(S)-benzoin forming benzil reductase n=1 Tax=Sporosalibacterium faouarense TaxID=516123 RepID=UPI00141C976A|nr:(S)-benzoin forming benzil reductase [Bacillota bacterium]
MNYIIVTGASKGLGKSITQKLMCRENHLICISRKENKELLDSAKNNNLMLDYIEYNLNDVKGIEEMMSKIFSKISKEHIQTLTLINNAGIVAPIKPLDKSTSGEIIKNVNINLIAPMILTSSFIKMSNGLDIKKRIINISSGAGKRPIFGWGSYCTSKAGIDMLTRCTGLEQEDKNYPVEIASFGPGIMDTDLQKEIRSSDKNDFKSLETFVKYKEEGKLSHPDKVADVVIELLNSEDFQQGGVIDVDDFQ